MSDTRDPMSKVLFVFIKSQINVSGTLVLWLEQQTLNQKNTGSNPFVAISKLGQFCTILSSLRSSINEYSAVDRGEYVNK